MVASDDEVVAWAEGEWLQTLEWCVTTYARATVATFRGGMLGPAAPPPEALIGYCSSMRGVDRDTTNDEYVAASAPCGIASLSVTWKKGSASTTSRIEAFV